ncbi:MAG: hypothetical protein GZ090_04255 [Oxalobacteraceae bacterium]|nr:hypothetical protein [Oxalobacteraceae bacterium]
MSRSQHVLVIDANNGDFETASDTIQLTGVTNEVRRAYSGTACPGEMRDCLQNQTGLPALVLLDLHTHNDDDRSAVMHLKSDGNRHTAPIVVISGSLSARSTNFSYQQEFTAQQMKSPDHVSYLQTLRTIVIWWLTMALLLTGREHKQ